ncbi:MAG: caspase family protein, partial [Ignavibacteria bacterium]|nr:caspase family protein [Ignavibacteria bacterium]
LFNWTVPESDVYIYYSGHGAPDMASKDAYFVPVDSDVNFIKLNGYPVKQLYKNLGNLNVKSVTVIIDACFSGISQAGKIISSASPVFVNVSDSYTAVGENMIVFTSSKSEEISSWDSKNKFGLFTYHFVNGFKEADNDGDGVITVSEMGRYLSQKVPYYARRSVNREQTPQVFGNKDKVLIIK